MTNMHRANAHTTARRARVRAARRRPSAELVAEGVVATYIHELSRRHEAPRRLGDRGARISSSLHEVNAQFGG